MTSMTTSLKDVAKQYDAKVAKADMSDVDLDTAGKVNPVVAGPKKKKHVTATAKLDMGSAASFVAGGDGDPTKAQPGDTVSSVMNNMTVSDTGNSRTYPVKHKGKKIGHITKTKEGKWNATHDAHGDHPSDFDTQGAAKTAMAEMHINGKPAVATKSEEAKIEEAVKVDKTKCPHCGSKKYTLMPTDFETAKCKDCGKTWDHGIVAGVNDPTKKVEFFRTCKTPLAGWDAVSDPVNTDTTQEDPTVDGLKKPLKYSDIMQMRHPQAKLKKPGDFLATSTISQDESPKPTQ